MAANPNIQRGFPNPSINTPKPQIQIQPQNQPQPQTSILFDENIENLPFLLVGPNYGYVPPNQQNINRQGGFGPSPQTIAPNFVPQQKGNTGDMRNMTNLVNKVGSPNFPQRPLDMKDEDVAMFKVPPKATCSIYVDGKNY